MNQQPKPTQEPFWIFFFKWGFTTLMLSGAIKYLEKFTPIQVPNWVGNIILLIVALAALSQLKTVMEWFESWKKS